MTDNTYAKGMEIILKAAESWERDKDGEWPDMKASPASSYAKAHQVTVTNKFRKANIHIVKQDSHSSDRQAHGDASLDGAQFQLYADRECRTKAEVFDAKGKAKTAEPYTVKDGQAETDQLRSGATYYLKEVKAPAGYLLSEEVLTIGPDVTKKAVEQKADVPEVAFGNRPVLGKIAIRKSILDTDTKKREPEPGAVFRIWLKSKGSYGKCSDYERAELTTDGNGYAETGDLYFGKYMVHQVSSGEEDTMPAADFEAEVTEDGKTYTFPVDNILLKAYLKIVKKDGDTEKTVLKAGTTYRIFRVKDGKEELVEQTFVDGAKKQTVDRFTCDATGEIVTAEALRPGLYRIYEVEAPGGYHIRDKYIEVPINSQAGNYESHTGRDGYPHATVTVSYFNEETYGKLKVCKTGEVLTDFRDGKFIYGSRLLKGAVFEVRAAEDIFTQDGQKQKWYGKGELVTTITTGVGAKFAKECGGITGAETGSDGMVTVRLPLGRYEVSETGTAYGYVVHKGTWKVEFNWKNKEDEFVLNATDATGKDGALRVKNARAKAQVSLLKRDADSRKPVKGAVFGIYTRHDIYNVDGKKIVGAGKRVGMMRTDADGKAESSADLPLMSEGFDRSKLPEMPQAPATERPAASATPAGSSGDAVQTTLPAEKMAGSIRRAGEDTGNAGTPEASGTPKTASPASPDVTGAASGTTSPETGTEQKAEKTPEASKAPVKDDGRLNSGDYYLKEISVSGSYFLDETPYPVHLEYKGAHQAVIAAGVKADNHQTGTVISKRSLTGSKELKGCRLEILDGKKRVIVQWTSGEKRSVKFGKGLDALGYRNVGCSFDGKGSLHVKGLFRDTKYTLKETRPADGYATADDISFELVERRKGETAVAVYRRGEMVMQDGNKVVMRDEMTKIRLIKLGSDTGQGLRGAKIEVLDGKGRKVLGFSTMEDGVDITGKLAVGKTYTFKEVEAPKGYKLAKPVKYTIRDTGKLQKVSMTDEKTHKPHVPQTGGMVPYAAALAAMALISGGLWFFFKRRVRR